MNKGITVTLVPSSKKLLFLGFKGLLQIGFKDSRVQGVKREGVFYAFHSNP